MKLQISIIADGSRLRMKTKAVIRTILQDLEAERSLWILILKNTIRKFGVAEMVCNVYYGELKESYDKIKSPYDVLKWMKEIQIGHSLCSPETLKTLLKNQVRQNAQPSVGRGIAKFR